MHIVVKPDFKNTHHELHIIHTLRMASLNKLNITTQTLNGDLRIHNTIQVQVAKYKQMDWRPSITWQWIKHEYKRPALPSQSKATTRNELVDRVT